MKKKDLQSKSVDELQKEVYELRRELIKERAQVAIGSQLKSPRKIYQLRKTVARIETFLQQKKRGDTKVATLKNNK
jgi:ribosomal protein L29